jgi:hypothetical protein
MEELKKFTETADMPLLTKNLNDLLVRPQERLLINQIKTFIPYDKQDAYEYLINNPNLANILSKPSKSDFIFSNMNNYQLKNNEIDQNESKSLDVHFNVSKNINLNHKTPLNRRFKIF